MSLGMSLGGRVDDWTSVVGDKGQRSKVLFLQWFDGMLNISIYFLCLLCIYEEMLL